MPPYTIGDRNKKKLIALSEAQNWRCAYCGIYCDTTHHHWNHPSREHVIPVLAYGLHEWENEVMACRLCNTGRGVMAALIYLAKVQEVGRWKAFRWAVRKVQRRAASRSAYKLRSTNRAELGA